MDKNLYKKTLADSVRTRYTPNSVLLEFARLTAQRRETLEFHMPYGEELKSFLCVKNGDPEGVRDFHAAMSTGVQGGGKMGSDALTQARSAFLVGITLFTRFAVEGGLGQEEAYSLSDSYICVMWATQDAQAIAGMIVTAGMDLANRVRETRRTRGAAVTACLHHISNHLHYKITVAELAAVCKRSPNYLSAHFRAQMGVSPQAYILSEKLEAARRMLLFRDCAVAEAAEQFAFPSHSAFSVQFKKKYGLSPSAYREQNRSAVWDSLK